MEKVRIGQITAPVGIRGEVRVFPYTDRESRFSDIGKVFLGEGEDERIVKKARFDKGMAVLKLSGVDDRNTAETLRGLNLYARKDLYILEDDTYFTEDLIGCSVFSEEGETLGELTEVIQNSSQDIYRVKKPGGGSFLVPAVKEFIKKVDIEKKEIVMHLIEGLTD